MPRSLRPEQFERKLFQSTAGKWTDGRDIAAALTQAVRRWQRYISQRDMAYRPLVDSFIAVFPFPKAPVLIDGNAEMPKTQMSDLPVKGGSTKLNRSKLA